MVNKYASASDFTEMKQKWRDQKKRMEDLPFNKSDEVRYATMKYDYEHGCLPGWKLEEFFELERKIKKKK